MRFRFSTLFACLLCVSAAAFAERRTEDINGKKAASREVLVKFRTSDAIAIQQAGQDADAEHSEKVGHGLNGELRLIRSRSKNIDALLRQLARRSDVEYAEPNYVISIEATPADSYFGNMWGLKNTGQTGGVPGADIGATAAWDLATGNTSAAVGVLDSGIDYNHPDLAANVWAAPAQFTVTLGGRSLTCPAGSRGFNAIAFTCDPLDDNGHGTHAAGTIGATGNNSAGVTGVNWTTRLIGVKMLDANGSGTTAQAVNAIDFLIQANAAFANAARPLNVRVLSASWGGPGYSQSLVDAINRANTNNMLFAAAAGNSGVNTDSSPHYPSGYNAPNIIAVAATDASDRRASFSNYGATSVDLAAPGVSILSTTRGGSYGYMSGTSMATPHVSGVAALALSYCQLSTAAVRDLILRSIDPVASMAGLSVTGGRLNAFKTLRGCAPATFALSAAPGSQSVIAGRTGSYTITSTPQNGFTGNISLSVTGAPAGVTATFATNPVSITGTTAVSTVMNVAVGASVAAGTYPLTVNGASGGLTKTATVSLTVTPPPAFTLSASPASRSITAGQASSFTFTLTPANGFSGAVSLAVSGLPAGATGAFSPNPAMVSATTNTTLNIATTASTAAGSYNLTVTATSGSVVRTAAVSLTIAAAPTALLPSAPVNVRAAQSGTNQIQISWTASSSNHTGFYIEGCQGAGCNYSQKISGSFGPTTYAVVHNGPAVGQVWNYRVRAFNASGNSPFVATAAVTVR